MFYFFLFVNDIPDVLTVDSYLFADDLKMFDTSKNANFDKMEKSLSSLSTWSNDWSLKVSPEKSECLHIGKNNALLSYSYDNLIIPQITLVRDLGIFYSNELSITCL